MISEPVIYSFSFSEMKVSLEMVTKMMGYPDSGDIPGPVNDSIQKALEVATKLAELRGGYVVTDDLVIDREQKKIFSHGEWFDTKKIVTHQLRSATKAAWFICTAGIEFSDTINQLMRSDDVLTGYSLDVVANIVVDEAMDIIQDRLASDMATSNLNITNRYSPGYCDWNIYEQKKLFKAFPENFLGISLTDSSLMIPMKSISGIIGIGPEVKFNNYTCNFCDQENCIYRSRKI